MLTNGYKIIELQYGVRRMMLNAPISMKFNNSIGRVNTSLKLRENVRTTVTERPERGIIRYQIRVDVERLDVNFKWYFLDISRWMIEQTKDSNPMINAQLNDIADLAAKEARKPFFANLMQQYNGRWLSYPNSYGGRSPLSDVSI